MWQLGFYNEVVWGISTWWVSKGRKSLQRRMRGFISWMLAQQRLKGTRVCDFGWWGCGGGTSKTRLQWSSMPPVQVLAAARTTRAIRCWSKKTCSLFRIIIFLHLKCFHSPTFQMIALKVTFKMIWYVPKYCHLQFLAKNLNVEA